VSRVRKLEREVEERFDEANVLESKTTRDHYLFLQPRKRLETCLLSKRGFQE